MKYIIRGMIGMNTSLEQRIEEIESLIEECDKMLLSVQDSNLILLMLDVKHKLFEDIETFKSLLVYQK